MRKLANKKIFPIGLGAMPLSLEGRPTIEESIRIIERFIELGGNLIDTANIYGIDNNDIGHNEKLIAKAISKIRNHNHITIATKVGGDRPNNGWGLGAGHPKQLRIACENSLKALKRDCIELYYLHGPDPKVPFSESLSALVDLQKEGKIKNIGIANVSLEQIKLATTLGSITAVQNRLNPFCKADLIRCK